MAPVENWRDVELAGGPQDGGRVRLYGLAHPFVFVGIRPMGDAYVSFTVGGPYTRKPCRYEYDGTSYRFVKFHPPSEFN